MRYFFLEKAGEIAAALEAPRRLRAPPQTPKLLLSSPVITFSSAYVALTCLNAVEKEQK